jgi:hypothetical protein
VSDFLDDRRKEITDRLKDLKPVVDEFKRLEAAAVALAEAVGSAVGSAASEAGSAAVATVTGRRGPGRPRGSRTGKKGPGRPRGSSTGKKGPGRPRGSDKRARKATQAGTPVASAPAATVALTADATPAVVERKKPGRPKGSGKKVGRPAGSGKKVGRPAGKVGRPKARRGGRSKGGGKRATEALSLVRGQPGITIPELAVKMGIKQNYLYRVLPGLEQEGKLEKKGRGWHPKAA